MKHRKNSLHKISLMVGLACILTTTLSHDASAKSQTSTFDKAMHNSKDLTGEIVVFSKPSQADVILGGALIGKTPLTIKKMPRDAKMDLVVKKEGFESWRTTVDFGNEHRKEYKDIALKME
ncbi:MAG: PEGA domain-containing protein [Deltaproteobacteria bacterium]|nr:MAG: PEGA domain-containing protein [Deltaproteobacteria bacterium]